MQTVEEKWEILGGQDMSAFAFDAHIDAREVPRYGVPEVALFLRLPENTLRSWVSGRSFPTAMGEKHSRPLIAPADPDNNGLSFF